MEESNKKAIVFTAHPDDHLCAAGTLMLLKDKGFTIHEVVATGGEKGVWWDSDGGKKAGFDRETLQKERKNEISKAAALIGIEKTLFLGLPDSEIVRSFELVEKIVGITRQEHPDIVFITNPIDYHIDHQQVGRIVTEAVERASWSSQPELGDSLKVPVVLYMEGFYFGKADVVVDITPYWEKKVALEDAYASQIDPTERRLLESMNAYRGFFRRDKKVVMAEAFELPSQFPIYLNRVMEMFCEK